MVGFWENKPQRHGEHGGFTQRGGWQFLSVCLSAPVRLDFLVLAKTSYLCDNMSEFERLLNELKSPDSSVRRKAAEALGKLRDPRAVGLLVEALRKDEDEEVHLAAIEALDKLGDTRAVGPLQEACYDTSFMVHLTAAGGLKNEVLAPSLDCFLARPISDSVRRAARR